MIIASSAAPNISRLPGQPGDMSETDRRELVETARQQWISALTDLGGRNTLLYYKDRRVPGNRLDAADPVVHRR
jgi:hypothetical protein